MLRTVCIGACLLCICVSTSFAESAALAIEPLLRVVDLTLGEATEVTLADGREVTVTLLELDETRGRLRNAVRRARVHVDIDGRRVWLTSSNYELPVTVGRVQVDCPITKGPTENSNRDAWGLERDARLRLWPAGSSWLTPDTFVYPVKQTWFASDTQMANEPCYVNACEVPGRDRIYYHYGLDFGGAEGLVEVVAATDGLVVSARDDRLPGHDGTPVNPRYDVVYILDGRGWYYRYSHFQSIDESIRPGVKVTKGQRLGLLGKEGGSGGWTHLHFDISARQPSGKWGCQEAYAFAWEAYRNQYRPKLIAVARPHHAIYAGETVELDGSRSFSAEGKIASFRWTFVDGTHAAGPTVKKKYDRPGYYSEILEVTGAAGQVDYDFAVVHVLDPDHKDRMVPAIHPAYDPTMGIKPGDEVTFKVRTFATTDGEETWDFGDDTATATTKSDGNVNKHAKDGYAIVKHRYKEPGRYLVRVERTDRHGYRAVGHLDVIVEGKRGK